MKSKLVFFDTESNSKKGTLRGFVIFPIFIALTILWFLATHALYKNSIDSVGPWRIAIALIFSGLLIVSALGVHNPDTLKKAAVFGALAGLVIYGVSNLSLLVACKKWSWWIALLDTVWGVLSTTFLAFILYLVTTKWPTYFKY
jgi:uncharacterized membrane protein